MSKMNKLQKFAELFTLPNVYENFDPRQPELSGENGKIVELKGEWSQKHFGNSNPIILELACGKGHYTLGLARRFPNINFIGVDIKGARIWKGAKAAQEEGLKNVAFLRTRIEQIAEFFSPGEISEIWITFPDPFLRKSKSNRRLTSPRFLERYRKILQHGGLVHLKTDSPELYEFSMEVFDEDDAVNVLYKEWDIYSKPLIDEVLSIKTFYEEMHLEIGRTIKYIRFTIHKEPEQ